MDYENTIVYHKYILIRRKNGDMELKRLKGFNP